MKAVRIMDPFVVQWLFDIHERVKTDAKCTILLDNYKKYSQQMQVVLTTLPDAEWHVVTNFLGVCFSLLLRLVEVAFVKDQ